MQNHFPVFGLIKKPRYLVVFLLVFGVIFYGNYYLMANLPGHENSMCVMGAGLNATNITFSLLMSLMAGWIMVGLLENAKNSSKMMGVKLGSTSILGLSLGSLTTFCTFCSLPALTLFGSSLTLSFFLDYENYIKLASLVLLAFGLYFVNKQLKEGCKRCVA